MNDDECLFVFGSGMTEHEFLVYAYQKALKEIEWLAQVAHCKGIPSVVGTKGIILDAISVLEKNNGK